MFFIAILMSAIVLVAIFLSVSPASIFLSVLSIATLDFSVLISIRLVNWSVKRKQSQTNENP
jgi:ABC-type multidrug transport system permease subunit